MAIFRVNYIKKKERSPFVFQPVLTGCALLDPRFILGRVKYENDILCSLIVIIIPSSNFERLSRVNKLLI